MPEKQKILRLQDIWRICNKVRAAIFRYGFSLWDYFKPLDPNNNRLISESKFIAVLAAPLKDQIGLSDKEICDLADYFRVQDGRIFYAQFCEILHSNVPEFDKNKPYVTGLEWDDPEHVNKLSATEYRKLCIIITQIAVHVNQKRLVLRPYFQEYELISKNSGSVTFAHFGRILKFLGIVLESEEFRLLVKRYAKDANTVNYIAFLTAIDEAQSYFDKHGMLSLGGELLDRFPGQVIIAELPKLPRPEIGNVSPSDAFRNQSVYHPIMAKGKNTMPLLDVIRRIQRHIFENRIRISEFFKHFDALNSSRVTLSQFRRALDGLQVSSLGRLYLAEIEIDTLIALYKDPNDPDRVSWRRFEDDINQVFTVKELEKLPNLRVYSPPQEIKHLSKSGTSNWQCEKEDVRSLCEKALHKIRHRIEERRILVKQFFKHYDRHNQGHVSQSQLRQILTTAAVLLSNQEEFALKQRYVDDLGFNYMWFLKELESKPIEQPLYHNMLQEKRRVNTTKPLTEADVNERNIVLILAKIKAKIVREGIKVKLIQCVANEERAISGNAFFLIELQNTVTIVKEDRKINARWNIMKMHALIHNIVRHQNSLVTEFMCQYDSHNECVITKADFIRSFDQLRCNLTCTEMETLMNVFQTPLRPNYIDYKKFGDVIEEAITTGVLERAPLLVPVQHVPSEASPKTFLNFEERHVATKALNKLCSIRKPNLEELFKDYDRENIGTVSKNCLIKALSVRSMLHLLSNTELDIMYKCFAVDRGNRLEMDYRAFIRALNYMQENMKNLPF